MPAQDPLTMMLSQMASGLGDMDKNILAANEMLLQSMSQGVEVLGMLAPHNVLANLAKGGGTFSARMTTDEMVSKNIFGAGGA